MTTAIKTEQLHGVKYEPTKYKGAVLHNFTLTDSLQETIDAYMEKTYEIIKEGESASPYFFLGDVSHPDVSLTPYFRGRLNELSGHLRDSKMPIFSAVILPDGLSGTFISIFGNFFSRNADTTQRYFTDRTAGERWLEEQVTKS